MDYLRELVDSKYHLSVAERLYSSYDDFLEKRFLVGVINELAKASSSLVKAYLVFEGVGTKSPEKNLKLFMDEVGPRYLGRDVLTNVFKTLEIERAQKESHVEFARGDKIILLVKGEYRILSSSRLLEFINSIKTAHKSFPHS